MGKPKSIKKAGKLLKKSFKRVAAPNTLQQNSEFTEKSFEAATNVSDGIVVRYKDEKTKRKINVDWDTALFDDDDSMGEFCNDETDVWSTSDRRKGGGNVFEDSVVNMFTNGHTYLRREKTIHGSSNSEGTEKTVPLSESNHSLEAIFGSPSSKKTDVARSPMTETTKSKKQDGIIVKEKRKEKKKKAKILSKEKESNIPALPKDTRASLQKLLRDAPPENCKSTGGKVVTKKKKKKKKDGQNVGEKKNSVTTTVREKECMSQGSKISHLPKEKKIADKESSFKSTKTGGNRHTVEPRKRDIVQRSVQENCTLELGDDSIPEKCSQPNRAHVRGILSATQTRSDQGKSTIRHSGIRGKEVLSNSHLDNATTTNVALQLGSPNSISETIETGGITPVMLPPTILDKAKDATDAPAKLVRSTAADILKSVIDLETNGDENKSKEGVSGDEMIESTPSSLFQMPVRYKYASQWKKLRTAAKFMKAAKEDGEFSSAWKDNTTCDDHQADTHEATIESSLESRVAATTTATSLDKKMEEVMKMEETLAKERVALQSERDAVVFERESLEWQLQEEIEKNQALSSKLEEHEEESKTLKEKLATTDAHKLLEEREALRKELNETKFRNSEKMLEKFEEIKELKRTITFMEKDTGGFPPGPDRIRDPVDSASKELSHIKLHADLTRACSSLVEKDAIITTQQSQMDSLCQLVTDLQTGTVFTRQLEEIKSLKEERENHLSAIQKKEETIVFMTNELMQMKNQVQKLEEDLAEVREAQACVEKPQEEWFPSFFTSTPTTSTRKERIERASAPATRIGMDGVFSSSWSS